MLRVLAVAFLLACSARELPPRGHVEVVTSPTGGDVAAWVAKMRSDLRAQGRTALVYEGAVWCEPCQRFHEAVVAGKLDAAFPNLTLLEFDADRDADRLALAGYAPRLIPYFAAPAEDGRNTGQAIEGGVKGDDAVDQITRRLATLVGPPSPSGLAPP